MVPCVARTKDKINTFFSASLPLQVRECRDRRASSWNLRHSRLHLLPSRKIISCLYAGQLELDLAHLGLRIFAGEVFAGGNGSRCEGAGSQEAKQNVEISGVGDYD